jgi:hypothetical protein
MRSLRFTEASVQQACRSQGFSAGKIAVQIAKMGFQLLARLPLRPIIRIVLQIAETLVLVLPVDVFRRFHVAHYSLRLLACIGAAINAALLPSQQRDLWSGNSEVGKPEGSTKVPRMGLPNSSEGP